MTDTTDWPTPATPPSPQPDAKPKMKLWKKLALGFGVLWLVGAAIGSSESNTDDSPSPSARTGSTSSDRTSNTNKPTGRAEDCSVWKDDYSECVKNRTHDQLDRYYTDAQSCSIESKDYLNCLNDAYHDSETPQYQRDFESHTYGCDAGKPAP